MEQTSASAQVKSLYDVGVNGKYLIESFPDEPVLNSYGFRKGQLIVKKRVYRFGGPVLIEADTSYIALGKDIAKKIFVREA